VDREIITAAKKKAIYRLADDAIHRIAGRVGLNEGAIPEYAGALLLGMGIIGGCDWGPCGFAFKRASSDVASSIVYS
jgi:hypothetical protein